MGFKFSEKGINFNHADAGFQAIPLERHGGGYIQGTFVTGERYFYLGHELKNDASLCRKFFDSRCQNYFRGSAPGFHHFKAVRLRQALLGVVSFAEATLLRRFFSFVSRQ